MIALDVDLLTGRYVASSFNDRAVSEWPPHPARLFSALLATAHEHEDITEQAREALVWLEHQGPPRILASEAQERAVVTVYVPGNTNRVLGDWSTQEGKLDEALAAVANAEHAGDEKALGRAQRAAAAAEKKLHQQMAGAVADDGKHNASSSAIAERLLPERRGKQPKTLPSVTPDEPRVRYLWSKATPDASIEAALSDLAKKLVRLGHSSSLVSCRLVTETGAGTETGASSVWQEWEPVEKGGHAMRTVTPGQVARLEGAFERHQGFEPRVLPFAQQLYRKLGDAPQAAPAESVFGEWLILRELDGEDGRRSGLRLQRTEDITRALRGALLHHADDPPPPVLTGHTPEGRPLERPHVAFLPLADVGSKHASGTVLGAAIVLPKDISAEDRRAVLRAVGRWEENALRLVLGRIGAVQLEHVTDREPRRTLDPEWWTRPSRRWASVTPVALDRNPGNLFSRDPKEAAEAAAAAEEIVASACEHVGLPRPKWVEIVRRSLFDAAPAARHYMPFPKKAAGNGRLRRVCVHVELCFTEPVKGPVLIGAGRYFGVGLCRGRE